MAHHFARITLNRPENNLAIIAGSGGSQRLARFVGRAMAMNMHLTG